MKIVRLLVLVCVVLAGLGSVRPALAASYVVNSTLDLPDADLTDSICATNPPGPVCTLRAAVMQANYHAGPDFISVSPGTYKLTRVGYDTTALLGDLDITEDTTIAANGGVVIVDANGAVTADRAFEVVSGVLNLSGITIQNGSTPSYGGAIYVQGHLSLTNGSVLNNTAALSGGGIYNSGPTMQITNSTIQGNTTQANGGGIGLETKNGIYPELIISGSTMSQNQATGVLSRGGGLYMYGVSAAIQNSNFLNNTSAGDGGGLYYSAPFFGLTLTVTNAVFDGNAAAAINGYGGGMYLYGQTQVNSAQVTHNTAYSGAGIYGYNGAHFLNDIRITQNTAAYACGGAQVSNGNLNMLRGWVDGNTAVQLGGGLCGGGVGSIKLTVSDTNILNNSAPQGGGVYSSIEFYAHNSAIYNNHATTGGGVYASGLTEIDNTTISGNYAVANGGGIYAHTTATVHLNSMTLASNHARSGWPSAGSGGGIYIASPAVATIANTVTSSNSNSPIVISYNDCTGALVSQGYNFISTNSGCSISGDLSGTTVGNNPPFALSPKIDPLQWLSGRTPGHPLLADSPLINAANPAGCIAANAANYLFVDQISHLRLGSPCDIGALEYFNLARVYLPFAVR